MRRRARVALTVVTALVLAACEVQQDPDILIEGLTEAERQVTASPTPDADPSDALTPEPTGSAEPTESPSPTESASEEPSPTPTRTTVTVTPTPTPTVVPTATSTPTPTPTPTSTATVTPTPTATNRSPLARLDGAVATAGETITVDVLANDTDPDGDDLRVTRITQPSHGRASFTDQSVRYTSTSTYDGIDELTYTISDGRGGTDTATVRIQVNRPNLAPQANDDAATVAFNDSVTINLTANDSDPDGDALSWELVSGPTQGTVSTVSDSSARYTHTGSTEGTDRFTYRAVDSQGATSATATVTVTIRPANSAPTANNDSVQAQYNTPITINLVANDTDPDGDSLYWELVSGPSAGAVNVVDDQTAQYVQDPDYYSTTVDSFTYRVVDPSGARSNTATVTIFINRNPIARNDSVSTFADTVSFNVISGAGTSGGTRNADSDPDNDTLRIDPISIVFSDGVGGTLNCSSSGACDWDPSPSCGGVTETVNYTLRDGRGGVDVGTMSLSASLIC